MLPDVTKKNYISFIRIQNKLIKCKYTLFFVLGHTKQSFRCYSRLCAKKSHLATTGDPIECQDCNWVRHMKGKFPTICAITLALAIFSSSPKHSALPQLEKIFSVGPII